MLENLVSPADFPTPAGAWLASYLPTQPLMIPPWLSCLSWALQEEEILTAFRTETGIQWRPGTSPIARMIDDATGADRAFLEAFVRWFTAEVWGDIEEGRAASQRRNL